MTRRTSARRQIRPARAVQLAAFLVPLCLAGTAHAAKVQVCHIPADDWTAFHTITISDKALSAHLAHGDLAGACDAVCASLCDDGDACTIDDNGACEQSGCPATRQPVDCDDGDACTVDTCDPVNGCMNTPLACTAPDACSVSVCVEGACYASAKVCGAGESCDPGTGECEVGGACPEGSSEYEGSCYRAGGLPADVPPLTGSDGRVNAWLTADAYCASAFGGRLVSIHSAAEQAFVLGLSGGGMIGLSDQGRAVNSFAWFDGSPVDYTDWNAGEPNNRSTSRGTEDCVQLTPTGGWNDLPCTDGGAYICKFAP